MSEQTEVAGVRSDMNAIAKGVEASAGAASGLWTLTLLLGIALVVWVAIGGPMAGVVERAEAMGRLWPLAAAWCLGLGLHSSGIARTRRELIKADALVGMTERRLARS